MVALGVRFATTLSRAVPYETDELSRPLLPEAAACVEERKGMALVRYVSVIRKCCHTRAAAAAAEVVVIVMDVQGERERSLG